jgi:hypothetical protein
VRDRRYTDLDGDRGDEIRGSVVQNPMRSGERRVQPMNVVVVIADLAA